MEPKDYNELMKQMLSIESLYFNVYSKLYYKLKAILEFTDAVS